MKILVTGAAGFIGSQLALRLLERGDEVIGFDNLSRYYDPELKKARLARLVERRGYTHVQADLADRVAVENAFKKYSPQRVCNLAAQAGVRYARDNPHVYVESNLVGFLHVLEACRHAQVEHLVFASSSSVYGANTSLPYSVHCSAEHPLSLYAATKKANEQMAHSYAHLFGLPVTGLRYFTVYGPWGRPDMALFLFTRAILTGEPIKVFNHGEHKRSFTYIDDAVEATIRVLDHVPVADPEWSSACPDPATSGVAPYRLFNVGSADSIALMRFIAVLEQSIGRRAEVQMLEAQAGDVQATEADCDDLRSVIGFVPQVTIETGVERFVRWYLDYYRVPGE